MSFAIEPRGPFDLANQGRFFGGWLSEEQGAIVMAFPVEGWRTSAAVVLRQGADGRVTGAVHPEGPDAERAWGQALAVVSLDVDGGGFPEIGRRDPVIGRLQERYGCLRPVLFHSPYEAAANFVIGQRISMGQARQIRQRLAEALGVRVTVGSREVAAFPDPQTLLGLTDFPGVNAQKIDRLHGIARAALVGLLDRAALRRLPVDDALAALRALPGVGPFSAQGILMRGAGLVDAVTEDDVTPQVMQLAYDLAERPNQAAVLGRAEAWRPYRMWCEVLLHVWLRREMGGPARPEPTRARGPRRRATGTGTGRKRQVGGP